MKRWSFIEMLPILLCFWMALSSFASPQVMMQGIIKTPPPAASGGTVSVDATSKSAAPSTATSKSWSHTINASSKLILIFAQTLTDTAPSSVTVGATTATLVIGQAETSGGTGGNVALYKVVSPSTGAQTVTINWGSSVTGSGYAISFLGTNGTVGTGGATQGSGSPFQSDLTFTSQTGDMAVENTFQEGVPFVCTDYGNTVQSGQTQQSTSNCTNNTYWTGMSTKPGAASVTLGWDGVDTWAQVGVNVVHN
jgi:hypothetical protein